MFVEIIAHKYRRMKEKRSYKMRVVERKRVQAPKFSNSTFYVYCTSSLSSSLPTFIYLKQGIYNRNSSDQFSLYDLITKLQVI